MQWQRNRVLTSVAALALTLGVAGFVRAEAPDAPKAAAKQQEAGKFLRFVDDNEGGGRLEAAVVTYKNDAGATVELVSAVHVGEKAYYDDLSKRFQKYDALLYEMVKPRDSAPPPPGFQSDSMVSGFQRMLKDVLELEFQLDAVDYTAENFVHADLDAETFAQMQEERGENLWILMLRSMLDEMSKPTQAAGVGEATLLELVVALTSQDRARHFKLILGRQFEDMEKKVAGMEGKDGSVIIAERNKKAVQVLKDTLAAGKKNVGVFYGAAHMSDIERRLFESGFKRTDTEWKTAWDMTAAEGDVIVTVKKAKKPEEKPAK